MELWARTIIYCDIYVTNYAIYVLFDTIQNRMFKPISRTTIDNTKDGCFYFLIVLISNVALYNS